MTTATIDHVLKTQKEHLESIKPGQRADFHEGMMAPDGIAQGDLYMRLCDAPPDGYVKVAKPQRQLVPEAGAGSHHRLASVDGVEMWVPKGWRVDDENWASLDGPFFRCSTDNEVVHENGSDKSHGTVGVKAGMGILCTYQRNFDAELQQERRAQD